MDLDRGKHEEGYYECIVGLRLTDCVDTDSREWDSVLENPEAVVESQCEKWKIFRPKILHSLHC